MNNTRIYSDIDMNFKPHPLTGDLVLLQNERAVQRAIENLIKLEAYEKPFNPSIGGNLQTVLFEPMDSGTAMTIETRIRTLLVQHEPRCNLHDIRVEGNEEENTYEITLQYNIVNQLDPITQRIFLQRVR